MLITKGFDDHVEKAPNKCAIHTGKSKVTYKECSQYVNRAANRLWSLGKQQSATRHVAMLLDNGIEFLQLFLAIAKAGLVAAPLDTKWNQHELNGILEKINPSILITEAKFLKRLCDIPSSIKVMVTDRDEIDYSNHNIRSFSLFMKDIEAETTTCSNTLSDQLDFYMGFTSGTTGILKAFVRTHRSWVESFKGSQIEFEINEQDHVLVPGPLVHSLFLYAACHTLYVGGTVYLFEKFSASKVVEWINSKPISIVYLVPTMFEAIYQYMDRHEQTHTSSYLRTAISSGAKLSLRTKAYFSRLFPEVNLFEFYGASELSFVTVLNPKGNQEKPDSVGRPFHNVSLSLRDDDGQEVATGEIGKLYVQSNMVFTGYYGNKNETNKVLQNGWATVGDFAKQDAEGYVYIVGREKNMIIYGGLNVYPEEVESVIEQLGEVDAVAVVGIEDDYWGEKVVAVIKLKQGKQLHNRDIQKICREYLSHYKCPRDILFVQSLPHTSSGKIAKGKLKQWLKERRGDTVTYE